MVHVCDSNSCVKAYEAWSQKLLEHSSAMPFVALSARMSLEIGEEM